MEGKKIRESFEYLIGYYTYSLGCNGKLMDSNLEHGFSKDITDKRMEKDKKILEILKENYEILFGGKEDEI